MVVCAPSRSSRSAIYMPIFARPPVSRARLPVRSAAGLAARAVLLRRTSGTAGGRRRRPRRSGLADVAGPRPLQDARRSRCLRRRRSSAKTLAVSSSIRPGAPVAVASVTAVSCAVFAARRSWRAALLDRLVDARRWHAASAIASGWSTGSLSNSTSTSRAICRRAGSISFTVGTVQALLPGPPWYDRHC